MTVLSGADLILPDRVLPHSSIVIEGDRIAAIEAGVIPTSPDSEVHDLSGTIVAPGFIDVHVHGVEGHDVLDGATAIAAVAARLPRYGVTGFCPTSVACDPATLAVMLDAVEAARRRLPVDAARVLPAHLESNFINPDYKGAQPAHCLRSASALDEISGEYSGGQILDVIRTHRPAVAIVTLAPELAGAMDLVVSLTSAGHIVSIGHSGATYEEACAAIAAGVRQATHLFNRMSPLSHRAPGVPGAVLGSEQVTAELICDGFHVHPALMTLALRAKGSDGIMAITDGTAGSGLPVGSVTRLGGQAISVTPTTAVLSDGTLAGSVLTMDKAFRLLVQKLGVPLVEAARLCSATPARQLGLPDAGRIAVGAVADLVVLSKPHLAVASTYIGGRAWRSSGVAQGNSAANESV